jgi:hypothetical protein
VIAQPPREFGRRSATWTAPVLCRYWGKAHGIGVSRKAVGRALDCLGRKRPRHELAPRQDTWRQAKGGSSAACGGACAPCA